MNRFQRRRAAKLSTSQRRRVMTKKGPCVSMEYDLNQTLFDRHGKPLKRDEENALTADWVAVNALDMAIDDYATGKPANGAERNKRCRLASKILDAGGKPDLVPEEAAMMKEVVGMSYPPIIVGQFFKIVDDTGKKKADEKEEQPKTEESSGES